MKRHTARKVGGTGRARQSDPAWSGPRHRAEPAGGRRGRWRGRGRRAGRARPAAPAGAALLAILLAGIAACGGDAPDDSDDLAVPGAASAAPADGPVALGVDVLFRDSLHLLEGRSVGLITNHTGLSWPDSAAGETAAEPAAADGGGPDGGVGAGPRTRENGVLTIDRLHRHPDVDLVALYSPEHGIRGMAAAGQAVEGGVDSATGLPIHSLYGDTRKPTPAMLDGIDVLVYDIQDIGARYYTYVWTMALAMEAAGEAGIDFVVLDRPNPIGGARVQGNVLDPDFATFVGLYPVPMRHGLTVGELARLLVGEHGVDVNLTVVPMEGWTRRTWWVQTGLPFVPPSPNMPSVASATHYPGTCLFEGTNLSVGRGTELPFQWIGAPWLDAELLAGRLNRMVRDAEADPEAAPALAGLYFEPTRFTPADPGDGKFAGREVRALRFVMTDPRRYDPTLAAVAALVEIYGQHPDELQWNASHFDRLAGTDALREGIVAGRLLASLVADWPAQIQAFEEARAPYLLYR